MFVKIGFDALCMLTKASEFFVEELTKLSWLSTEDVSVARSDCLWPGRLFTVHHDVNFRTQGKR